jgi:hypothetical protein
MKEKEECSRLERMASLLFAERGGEFVKDGILSSAQNRGRTPNHMITTNLVRPVCIR